MAPWEGKAGFGIPDWNKYTIVESTKHPELLDRTITDVAAERGQQPFDVMLDLALDEPDLELRVRAVFLNDDTEEVAKLLVDEHCTLGLSDAGAHVGQLCDAPEPTDFLGNWVRDRNLMPLETAVRKLTGVAGRLPRPHRSWLPARGRLGRRRGVRRRHGRARPAPPCARLPGERGASHRRSTHRDAPRRRERHAGAGRR